jgi:hypothetical protein
MLCETCWLGDQRVLRRDRREWDAPRRSGLQSHSVAGGRISHRCFENSLPPCQSRIEADGSCWIEAHSRHGLSKSRRGDRPRCNATCPLDIGQRPLAAGSGHNLRNASACLGGPPRRQDLGKRVQSRFRPWSYLSSIENALRRLSNAGGSGIPADR